MSTISEQAKCIAELESDKEAAVSLVLAAGLSTGHAETFAGLMEEVLWQYTETETKQRQRIAELKGEVARLKETESGDLFHERQMRQHAEAKLRAVGELPDKWCNVNVVLFTPDHENTVDQTGVFNLCADELRAILKEVPQK